MPNAWHGSLTMADCTTRPIAPSPDVKMAQPLFCERFLNDFGLQAL